MGFTHGVASKVKRLFYSRPIKEKRSEECNIVNPELDYSINDFGSKDENFFDTRGWLDSDCEDDYYSVNGDFTPSRGSTPIRHFGTIGTLQTNNKEFYADMFPENRSESSPTDKKKLADLLQVALNEQEANDLNSSANKVDDVATPGVGINGKTDATDDLETSQLQTSSDGTPKPKKERSGMITSCCFPVLSQGISSRK